MPDQLQDVLLHRPTAPQAELPREAPNRPLGQDYLGDAVDMLLGGVGINNPLDPKSSSATAIGGMAGMLPLGKLFSMLRGLRGAKMAKTVAQLPEELQGLRPSGHEFNAVAHPTLDPEEALKEIELTNPPRNRGSYDPPHDGSLPKHKEVIPAYREKSGIAVDVLDDMKHSVPPPHSPSHLHEFAGKNSNQLPNNIYSSAEGDEPRSLLFLEDDPAKFVGHLRSFDNVDALHTGQYAPHRTPGMIETMVQDLANHFTSPTYDPFHQAAVAAKRAAIPPGGGNAALKEVLRRLREE